MCLIHQTHVIVFIKNKAGLINQAPARKQIPTRNQIPAFSKTI